MTMHRDDTGAVVRLDAAPRKIVSLVPSLTEAVAASAPGTLAGVTDWCSHPADLDAVRIGGTKNPDIEAIMRIAPDLTIANAEENRAEDIDALRSAGRQVWVTDIRTVEQALVSMARLLAAIEAPSCSWLDDARSRWDGLAQNPAAQRRRAVITIWRRPWMHVGSDTYAGDVLRRLGIDNVLADSPERYPRIRLEDLPPYDLAVLPDEPYAFSSGDGPESFDPIPCALVDGRSLTWYGPAMVDAPLILASQLAMANRAGRQPSSGR
jgi:ABC-type Fe3+-hydroxamate transport system substrate-binding protein